jgi:hypothetical protein
MRILPVLCLIPLAGSGSFARDYTGLRWPSIDLLRLVELRHDVVRGSWEFQDRILECTEAVTAARVMVPYLPPEEYSLVIEAERKEGRDALVVGLASGDCQFVHVLDGYTAEGKCLSGFEVLDGTLARSNESTREGQSFTNGVRSVVVYTVRKGSVGVTVDGRRILDWKGNFSRLSVRADYRILNPGTLFIGAWMSKFRITRMSLLPLSPGGRRLREPR